MAEVFLPSDLPGLTFDVKRSPMFKTAVNILNGRERNIQIQTAPAITWSLTWDYIGPPKETGVGIISNPNELAAFIFARRVDWDFFYYRDPDDCLASAMPFGYGDGHTTKFQITRTMNPTYPLIENVYVVNVSGNWFPATPIPTFPVGDTAATFFVNGTLTSVTGVDRMGNVTFPSAPGAGLPLTWSGNFYYRCRFKNPSTDIPQFMHNFWELKQLEFETVKYSS
jgi:Conserved hypothetical protein 2217 (DUF2460)